MGMPKRFDSVKEMLVFLGKSKRLSNKDAWDIITAFRGPDSKNYTLKSETTARIRSSLLSPVGRDSTTYTLSMNDSEIGKEFRSALATFVTESHFNEHAEAAAKALQKIGRARGF